MEQERMSPKIFWMESPAVNSCYSTSLSCGGSTDRCILQMCLSCSWFSSGWKRSFQWVPRPAPPGRRPRSRRPSSRCCLCPRGDGGKGPVRGGRRSTGRTCAGSSGVRTTPSRRAATRFLYARPCFSAVIEGRRKRVNWKKKSSQTQNIVTAGVSTSRNEPDQLYWSFSAAEVGDTAASWPDNHWPRQCWCWSPCKDSRYEVIILCLNFNLVRPNQPLFIWHCSAENTSIVVSCLCILK